MHRASKKRIASTALIIIVVLVVSLVAIKVLFGEKSIVGTAYLLPFGINQKYFYTGDGFLYAEASRVCFHKLSSTDDKAITIASAADTQLAGSTQVKLAYEESALYIFSDDFTTSKTVKIEGKISLVKCSEGYIAIHYKAKDTKIDTLLLQDKTGKETDRIEFTDSSLTDFGFYIKDKQLCLYTVSVDTASIAPTSTITTYGVYKNVTTGVISVQNQLVERVYFTNTDVVAFGTNNIIRYASDGNYESYRLLSYGFAYNDCSFGSSVGVAVMKPNDSEAFSAYRIYSFDRAAIANEKIAVIKPREDTINIFSASGRAFSVSSELLTVYKSNGTVLSNNKLPHTVDNVIKLSESKLLITSGSKLYVQAINLNN